MIFGVRFDPDMADAGRFCQVRRLQAYRPTLIFWAHFPIIADDLVLRSRRAGEA